MKTTDERAVQTDERAVQLVSRLDAAAPTILAANGRVPSTEYDWDTSTNTLTVKNANSPKEAPKFNSVYAQWNRNNHSVTALRYALGISTDQLKISEENKLMTGDSYDVKKLRRELDDRKKALLAFEHDLRHHPDIINAVRYHNSRFCTHNH